MAALRHLSPAARRWLLLVVAVALFARALTPAGWMPVADADGPHLVLCDGAQMAMPMAMKAHGGMPMHHHGAPDHPCSFAAAAAAAIDAPTLAAPLLAPRAAVMVAAADAGSASIGHGLAAPPPPPTGPPAFA